jgi:putative aldouronate transport system permease protein
VAVIMNNGNAHSTNSPRRDIQSLLKRPIDEAGNGTMEMRRRLAHERLRRARKMGMLYVFFLVPAAFLFVFNYIPIYGVIIAFKDFSFRDGILGSDWNNFEHFRQMFVVNPYFGRVLRNTLVISFGRILFELPAPILLALLLNEVRNRSFKRVTQTITYLPHFMSWVVLSGILFEVLSPQRGVMRPVSELLGVDTPSFFTDPQLFVPMVFATNVWQDVGWGTIIYLAAITSIDPNLYESAVMDGAGRFRQAVHITLPSIVPIITIVLLLRIGRVMNAGFDQIFNLYNPLVYEVADIIDTYVYRVGLLDGKFDFASAVGLFKNVVGVSLILIANYVVRKFSEYGLW